MFSAQILLTIGLILLILFLALLASPHIAYSVVPHDHGHRDALVKRARLLREIRLEERKAREEKEAEARRLARKVAEYSRRYGPRVGRWYPLVARYFPKAQIDNALYCIKHESGGDPWAHNGIYHGLFQLGGWSCNVWPPETNVRLAAKLWRSRGWQPWSVMN